MSQDLHLKLDRILANQAKAEQERAEIRNVIETLTTGLSVIVDGQNTQTEVLSRLAEAVSKESDGGEMRRLIERIEAHLAQISADGSRMVTVLNGLPRAVSDAAVDGVRMAMGEAVDVKDESRD